MLFAGSTTAEVDGPWKNQASRSSSVTILSDSGVSWSTMSEDLARVTLLASSAEWLLEMTSNGHVFNCFSYLGMIILFLIRVSVFTARWRVPTVCVSKKTRSVMSIFSSDHSKCARIVFSSRLMSARAWAAHVLRCVDCSCSKQHISRLCSPSSFNRSQTSVIVGQSSGSCPAIFFSDLIYFRSCWMPRTMSSFSPFRVKLRRMGAFSTSTCTCTYMPWQHQWAP